MIRDLDLHSEARPEYDVCIIGSGPAGLAVAGRLARPGVRVGILESGGLEGEDEVQGLNQGQRTGFEDDLVSSRPRRVGGASRVWAGHCAPLDPDDFEAEPWSGSLGWPISADDLAPHYPEAFRFLGISPDHGNPGLLVDPCLLPSTDGLESKLIVQRATRLGETRRQWLEESDSVDLWTHATLVGARSRGRKVEAVVARSLGGSTMEVRARLFVLAAGGLENPRLLLWLARQGAIAVDPAAASRIGRTFCVHPHFFYGALLLTGDAAANPLYLPHEVESGTFRTAALQFDRETRRSEGLVKLLFRHEPMPDLEREGMDLHALGVWEDRKTALLERLFLQGAMPMSMENRVELGSETDALGIPRVRVSLSLDPTVYENVRRSLELYVTILGRTGFGRVRFDLEALDEYAAGVRVPWGGHHFMCATRMSEGPGEGVVDPDSRVHGSENLYLAGASTFGSPGAINPTLTLTALALRLGEHLARRG